MFSGFKGFRIRGFSFGGSLDSEGLNGLRFRRGVMFVPWYFRFKGISEEKHFFVDEV